MSVEITERDLKEALAELEAIRQEKANQPLMPENLYRLLSETMKDKFSRRPDKVTWLELAHLVTQRGWWNGSENALRQAYRKEKIRREGQNK